MFSPHEVTGMGIAQFDGLYWGLAVSKDQTMLWIILLGLGGIGFILAGLAVSGKLSRRQKAPPQSTNRSAELSPIATPFNSKYCPQCGTANPLEAGFCTKCGTQFPSQ
jgi:ribosomal protein L40E